MNVHCTLCDEYKPRSDFYLRETSTKAESICKKCRNKRYQARPERKLTVQKYRKTEKWQYRKRETVLKKYGLTPEEYDARVEANGGVCEICKQPETKMQGNEVVSLSVDHCHTSMKVRGIICDNCNVALGRVNDSVEVLQSMIEYLRRNDDTIS